MSGWRIGRIITFAVISIICLVYLSVMWSMIHHDTCNSSELLRPCSEIVPRLFAEKALPPTLSIWGFTAWLTFRDWNKK